MEDGRLSSIGNGIYRSENGDYDELLFLQYRHRKAIYSYETALSLLGVGDKFMGNVEVTVPYRYKISSPMQNMHVSYVNIDLLDLGVTEVKMMFGHTVKAYGMERTICDFIRNEKKMDHEVYVNTLKSYGHYENRDTHLLYEIAPEMKIEDKVSRLMEVIL